MTATYDSIASTTLGSNQATVSFTSISGSYTDLVLICNYRDTASGTQTYPHIRFNGDTASNYSFTRLHGNGSSAVSGRASNQTYLELGEAAGAGSTADYFTNMVINIQNYSNSTTNKTVVYRTNNVGGAVQVAALVGLWRSTSAITSLVITGQTNIASGSTFHLYGIKAE